jgi:raffinose synthase
LTRALALILLSVTAASAQQPAAVLVGDTYAHTEREVTRLTEKLTMTHVGKCTLVSLRYHGAALQAEGGIDVELDLPDFARGLSIYRSKPYWTRPVVTSEPGNLAGEHQMLLWQRRGRKDYEFLAPLAGHGMIGSLGVRNFRFGLHTCSHTANYIPGEVPLFVYGHGTDPYQLIEDAYRAAGLPLRRDKRYPSIFQRLGWCSWNAFETRVDATGVVAAARWFHDHHVPVKTVLVDDGWMQIRERKLAGFEANQTKFPGGLAALTANLHRLGISDVGVWHALQGYWDGVVPTLDKGLWSNKQGLAIPDPCASDFYADWYDRLRTDGISFVKVDNQAGTGRFTDGVWARWEAATGLQRSLQQAAGSAFDGCVINCMEMTLENVYNWTKSDVARSSDDYLPGVATDPAEHLLQNAYNALWIENFAVPDYDMFQTDGSDAEFQATARALSGGPVFSTDRPGRANADVLRHLCLADGRLLQPDGPGRVPRSMLFHDPSLEPVALQLEGEVRRPGYTARVVGSWNAQKTGAKVFSESGLAYRFRAGRCQSGPFALGPLGWEICTRVPVRNGIAVFGRLDKYVGAAAVESVDGRRVRLLEGGPIGIWVKRLPARVIWQGKLVAFTVSDHFLRVRLPSQPGLLEIID